MKLGDVGEVGNLKFTDLLIAGVVKSLEEKMLAPYIGNGTLMSGGIKLFAGAMIPSGKWSTPVKAAFTIDGVEDIVNGLMGGIGQGGDSEQGSII